MLRPTGIVACVLTVMTCGCSEQPLKPLSQSTTVSTSNQIPGPATPTDSSAALSEFAKGDSEEVSLRMTPGAEELRRLAQLPSLRRIDISTLKVTRDHLDALAEKCPNLESIEFSNAVVTPDLLVSLQKVKSLRRISIHEHDLTDEAMKPLRGLPLTSLTISTTAVTDAGMEIVGTLVKLEELVAHDLPLTDAGIGKLESLSNMRKLSLSHTEISDGSLRTIGKMRELTNLYLNGTQITDTGLAELTALTKLRWVDVSCRGLTDSSLVVMAGWPQIETLSLWDTQITDAGLETLGRMKTLQNLEIGRTKVSDAGLPHLENLSLQSLNLSGTDTTAPGISKLKKAIPEVKVYKFGRLQ